MKVLHISVTDDKLVIFTDCVGAVAVRFYSPALRENKLIGELKDCANADENESVGGKIELDRFINGRDALYLRCEVEHDGQSCEGVKYCDSVECTPMYNYTYPVCESKKGLQVAMIKDAIELGVRHAALNVCIGDLMRKTDDNDAIIFTHDGRDYYFDPEVVEAQDARIKELSDAGIIITLILLCSKSWARRTPENMYSALLHPDYDDDGRLSAFNIMTDEGARHYAAFIAFLTTRYCDPAQTHGRAVGFIISNEVNSHWIWGNAGHKTVEEYAREYTSALRIACLASSKIWLEARVYVSLDHFWTGAQDTKETDKYTGSRYLMEHINKNAKADGDFYWNIAFHPYPENLNYPDFWNDKTATFDNDTYRVTFKNLSVLRDFVYAEENLYNGKRRRIILSEQGFNSHWTPESEILQACAYGRAYRAVMEIPEIDSFILHAHCDNAEEFGLNLGLWRRKREGGGMDAPKPIYYVFKAIDKPDETGRYHWERY